MYATRHAEPAQPVVPFMEGGYRKGVWLCVSRALAAGLLTSFSAFVAIDRIRIRLSLKKDMRKTLKTQSVRLCCSDHFLLSSAPLFLQSEVGAGPAVCHLAL